MVVLLMSKVRWTSVRCYVETYLLHLMIKRASLSEHREIGTSQIWRPWTGRPRHRL